MGNKLHQLGKFAYEHPWRIVFVWVVMLGILGFSASQFIAPTSPSISIPGTQAQKTIDRATELFPDSGEGSGRIVFKAPAGKTISDYEPQITKLTKTVSDTRGVTTMVSPFVDASFVADSGMIAYSMVQLEHSMGSIEESTLATIIGAVNDTKTDGLQIEVAGDLIDQTPGEILGIGEVAGVGVALLVLVVTLGSLIAAGMPIVTALVAIGVSMSGLFSMSQLFTINATTPVLAVMLGLAVGIDYSLFIINKYRRLVLDGYAYKSAAAKAVGTAGNAVVFAALTVVIALSALTIVNIPFMSMMGLAAAATVAIAALVSISLVPAMLGVAGKYTFSRKTRNFIAAAQKTGAKKVHKVNRKKVWYKWGEKLVAHPLIVLGVSLAVIVAMSIPAASLKLGLPTDEYAASDSTQKKAYDLLAEGFGVGFNAPLTVVVEGMPAVSQADKDAVRQQATTELNKRVAEASAQQKAAFETQAAQVTSLEQQMALQQQVAAAQTQGEAQMQQAMAQIDATVEQYARLVQLKAVADSVAKVEGVQQVLPAAAVQNGTAGILQVIPTSAPSDDETDTLISQLRKPEEQVKITGSDKISLAVTGSTALQGDINNKLAAALPQYLAVVVGLSLILLVVAFRSVLVPIKATLGFLLSVLAMFGALVAVFQWGWFGIAESTGPIVSFIPIIAIGILFGLAMDYEFFLVSSMHESYSRSKDAKKAVIEGFGVGSKVVTAAGIIMVSVFAGFITNHDITIQAIGFGLAVGIFVDAFIVRMTIVPAVMALLGKSAWWLPKWLEKRLPHVSIEGEE